MRNRTTRPSAARAAAQLALAAALATAGACASTFEPGALHQAFARLPAADPGPPDPHSATRTAERRRAAAALLGDGAMVVAAGEEADARFEPEPHHRWLAGATPPGTHLVLLARGAELALERLYLPERDARGALWDGAVLGPGPDAAERTGIADTRPLAHLEADLDLLLAGEPGRVVGSGAALARRLGKAEDELLRELRELLAPELAVREWEELSSLRAAIDVTQAALAEAMAAAVPGAHEYTAEAALLGGFRRRGAEGLAFPPICGSGPNSCVLHHRANERRLEAGDLLVLDVGARYRGYCADVTRTIPVSGVFTPRQREIYAHVHAAAQLAAAELRPGSSLQRAHEAALRYFEQHGLAEAFRHSVGHGLGLLVHDFPGRRDELRSGMVVTIEPGLYLPEEELGVRIEDDWLITPDGAELLSGAIPSEPDALLEFLAALRGS